MQTGCVFAESTVMAFTQEVRCRCRQSVSEGREAECVFCFCYDSPFLSL